MGRQLLVHCPPHDFSRTWQWSLRPIHLALPLHRQIQSTVMATEGPPPSAPLQGSQGLADQRPRRWEGEVKPSPDLLELGNQSHADDQLAGWPRPLFAGLGTYSHV